MLVVLGGSYYTGDGSLTDDLSSVEILDLEEPGRECQITELPEEIHSHQAVAYQGRTIYCGGVYTSFEYK